MHNLEILQRVGLVACVVFIIAFVLTLWPGRRQSLAAAVLYAAGLLTYTGCFVYHMRMLARFVAVSTDTIPPNIPALMGWVWPLWTVAYAAGAAALLWPSIPQKKALRFGKIWHLTIGLPLIAVQIGRGIPLRLAAIDAGWLVYALLWFRIREGYAVFIDQPKGDSSGASEEAPSRPGSISPRLKWGLYFGAWGAVILATLATRPEQLLSALTFPLGLVALLPNGEQKAIETWMLQPISIGFGWIIYSALTFVMSCTKKLTVFSPVYILFCLLLALNVVGCNKLLEAVAGIH